MVRRKIIILCLAFFALPLDAAEVATRFSVAAPEAKAVFLAGEFNHWSTTATPMQRTADGAWVATVPLTPGKHAYKFVVDGDWRTDAANPEQTKDGFGGLNSIMTVSDVSIDPVLAEKDAVRREAMRLMAKSDFAGLDNTAGQYRREKARFTDGLWKLKEFYDGLGAKNEIGEEKDWRPWFEKMEKWRAEKPDSITQPVVLARGWLNYADDVIGNEFDKDSVSNARVVLETAAQSGVRCPNWYYVMQSVARRQRWSREEYETLLSDAAKAEPAYYYYYASAAEFYYMRGNKDEIERIAEDAAMKFDPAEGMSAYARTIWFSENMFINVFAETKVSWPKLRQGFIEMEKAFPKSRWNMNAFCRFAVQAKDRQTAGELFRQLGQRGEPNWGSYGSYEMARRWADSATPSWQIEPMRTITMPGKAGVQAIAWSPDGQSIASGDGDGRITLWEANTGKEIWSERVASFPVASVTFSSDGKLLAAGAGQTFRATKPGMAKVWDLASRKEIASSAPAGVVWKVAFTPDAKSLALTGGQWEKNGEAGLLDLASGAVRALPWAEKHDHIIKAVAISPDGKTLATDCFQSVVAWSLSEERILAETKNLVKDFVLDLVFAPDGKTLATCGAPLRGHNDEEPGELVLWDTTTWKPRDVRSPTDAGGLVSVAYSADGKWIAAGGYDRAVHVWDSGNLQSKAIFVGHGQMIQTVAFAPDGDMIASGGKDGAIKLWRFPK